MAIEIISTLKPKNNGTFPIAEAADISVDENGTRLDAKLAELDNNAGSGGSGGGGGGIIDVAELPTEGIDESALYRVPIAVVYYGKAEQQTKVHIVNGLPDTGENVSANMKTIDHTYYNIADSVEYVYMSETIASAMGMAGGWYPASTMYPAVGLAYGGIITELELDIPDKIYLLFDYEIYHYKNNVWYKVEKERPQIYIPTSAGEIVSIGDDDYKKIINHWRTLDLYLWNHPLAEKFTLTNRSSTEYVFTRQWIKSSAGNSDGGVTYGVAFDVLKIKPHSKTYEFTRALIDGAPETT